MVSLEQLRSHKLAGYAIFDFVATFAVAALLSAWKKYKTINVFLIFCLASIFIHVVSGVETKWIRDLKAKQPLAIAMVVLPVIYLYSQRPNVIARS